MLHPDIAADLIAPTSGPAIRMVSHVGSIAVERTAFYTDGRLAWLHRAVSLPAGDVAALICSGLFWDAPHAHFAVRQLADTLAAVGIPTLRIDHPGCGDAADLPPGADAWAAWQAGVDSAAGLVRQLVGASRLLLCGMRLGGTLATLAATRRNDCVGLLLVSPVLRGKSYLRQLRVEAQMEEQMAPQPDGGIAFQEHVLTGAACQALEAVDLARVTLPSGLAVAMARPSAPNLASLCMAAWSASGASCTMLPEGGLTPLVAFNPCLEAPADFAAIVAWVAQVIGNRGNVESGGIMPISGTTSHELISSGWTERAVQFGPHGKLFGVYSEPAERSRTGVLILNTACDPHYGIGRFGTQFARSLAAAGIASLRMDFNGLGDSDDTIDAGGSPSEGAGKLFETPRQRDARAGLDWLVDTGVTHLAVQGLCSGAYHAWHAAVADTRVNSLLLVNMPAFTWKPGTDVRLHYHVLTTQARYLRRLLHARFWWRLLHGDVPLARVLHGQWQRLCNLLKRPAQSGVSAKLAELSRRGTRSYFLFGEGDPGLEGIRQEMGSIGANVTAHPGTVSRVFAGLNHNISSEWMRREVASLLIAQLDISRDNDDLGRMEQ